MIQVCVSVYDIIAMIGISDQSYWLAEACQTLLLRVCRKGMDLYFERHDGQAVTCDDFLAAMADANDQDLSSVARWSASRLSLLCVGDG